MFGGCSVERTCTSIEPWLCQTRGVTSSNVRKSPPRSLLHASRHFQGHSTRAPASKDTTDGPVAAKRAVLILPGLGNSKADYAKLATELESKGLAAKVVDVSRVDWLRNAAGLRYLSYWRGTLTPRPTVDWYLRKVEAAVEEVKQETDGAPISLLAHSAGGWLARVFLLDYTRSGIDRLVTLGSPHLPPPPGVIDQTRGILTYCSSVCPGAFHPEVRYVTIGGKYILGAGLQDEGASWQQRVVGAGYQQVCGEARVWGDGVVPLPSLHLEGAENMDLDGVYHSPLGSVDGNEEGQTARPWYGTAAILDQWVDRLVASPDELWTPVPTEPEVQSVA